MPSELNEMPGYQLWLATNRWQRMLRKVLEPLGITHVQYIVLVAIRRLAEKDEYVTQAAVCRFGALDPNMASEVIRSLEKKELVIRAPHPEDGRAMTLTMTPAGTVLSNQAREDIRPLIKEFFAPLGEDRTLLACLLKRLNEHETH
jgi:DNA-binding MarR family transcriptional regulator